MDEDQDETTALKNPSECYGYHKISEDDSPTNPNHHPTKPNHHPNQTDYVIPTPLLLRSMDAKQQHTWYQLLMEIREFFFYGILIPFYSTAIKTSEHYRNCHVENVRRVPKMIYDRLKQVTPQLFLSLFPFVSNNVEIHVTEKTPYILEEDEKGIDWKRLRKTISSSTSLETARTTLLYLEEVIPMHIRQAWYHLMESISEFYRTGILVPIDNPALQPTDHYDNMSTDYYRQVPVTIYFRLKEVTLQQLARMFRYVPVSVQIDLDPTPHRMVDLRSHVLRNRGLGTINRRLLDQINIEVIRFAALGLLIPVEGPHLSKKDHYRNPSKYPVRQVPKSIYGRLNQFTKKELTELFPKSTGDLQIYSDPLPGTGIRLEKSNVVYVNSLQASSPTPTTHIVSPIPIRLLEDVSDKDILTHLMTKEQLTKWKQLQFDIRRFFHVGLLIPTSGTPSQPEERYRNFSPDSYRYVPTSIYDRLERILQTMPNKRQIRALFPNIQGRVYLNTDPTSLRRPFRISGPTVTKAYPHSANPIRPDNEIIGEGTLNEDEEEFDEIQGIANLYIENGKVIQSIDAKTGAGNITIQAQVSDPELLEWTNQQVSEYSISLKPLDPNTAEQRKDMIIPPIVRDGYRILPRRVSIEGNLGSGKSALLSALQQHCNNRPEYRNFHFIHEPTDIWSSFGENDKTLLELYMKEPSKYGFLFQVMAHAVWTAHFRTHMYLHQEANTFISERSTQSADLVYTQMLRDRNHISKIQDQIYQTLLEEEGNEDIYSSDIIYLDTQVETCMRNIGHLSHTKMLTRTYYELCKRHLDTWYHHKARHSRYRISGFTEASGTLAKRDMLENLRKYLLSRKERPKQHIRHRQKLPVIISLEGNIGSGKTTLLKQIARLCEINNRRDILVIPEPTSEWDKVGTREGSILNLFYKNRSKYAFAFQTLVCTTIRSTLKKAIHDNPHIEYIIMERSLDSSRFVFARMLASDGSMTPLEHQVYESLFLDQTQKWMKPSKMIYVETEPQICIERIRQRANKLIQRGFKSREGERFIDAEYLSNCASQHEYLFRATHNDPIRINGNIEDTTNRQQTINNIMKLMPPNPAISSIHLPPPKVHRIEHVFSARTSPVSEGNNNETEDASIEECVEEEDGPEPEDIVLSGTAQLHLHNGRAVRNVDPITGSDTIALTAHIHNPEQLTWLIDRADKYEIVLRPISRHLTDKRTAELFPIISDETVVKKPRIVSIEGNIGSGKTELLAAIELHCVMNGHTEIITIPEPTNEWTRFKENDRQLIDLYFSLPHRYGFLFQVMTYTLLTRLLRKNTANAPEDTIFICERSIASSQHVYTKFLREQGHISELQKRILNTLFHEEGVRDIAATDLIYLKTLPDFCVGQVSRTNEDGKEIISLDYLRQFERLLTDHHHHRNGESCLTIQGRATSELPEAQESRMQKIIKFLLTKKRKAPEYIKRYTNTPEILSVEGITGAGKTNILRHLFTAIHTGPRHRDVFVLYDSTNEADRIFSAEGQLLDLFYTNTTEFGFMHLVSQITMLRTRLKEIIRDCIDVKYIVCERSISSIFILAQALHELGHLTALELQVIEEMCEDPTLDYLKPKRAFYIDTDVITCIERIRKRVQAEKRGSSRPQKQGERHITAQYLIKYKDKLDQSLLIKRSMRIDGNQTDRKERDGIVPYIIQQLQEL